MGFDLDPQLIIILICFGFLAAFIDSVVGGGGRRRDRACEWLINGCAGNRLARREQAGYNIPVKTEIMEVRVCLISVQRPTAQSVKKNRNC